MRILSCAGRTLHRRLVLGTVWFVSKRGVPEITKHLPVSHSETNETGMFDFSEQYLDLKSVTIQS